MIVNRTAGEAPLHWQAPGMVYSVCRVRPAHKFIFRNIRRGIVKYLATVLLAIALCGKAAAEAPPTYGTLAKMPVVRFGDPVPNTDHILMFEPGQPITMTISIEGSLFSQPSVTDLVVTPSRTIFVYKEWASLDGEKWLPRGELIKSDVQVKIPGYNHPMPGMLKVRMDLAAH
jgi:hypothetical protein